MVAHYSLRDHIDPPQLLKDSTGEMKTDEDLVGGRTPGGRSSSGRATGTPSTPANNHSDPRGEYGQIPAAEEGRAADNDNDNINDGTSRSNAALPMPIVIDRNILLLCLSAVVIDLAVFILWCITGHVAKLFGSPISDEEWHTGVRATHPMGFFLASVFDMVFFLTYWLRASDHEDVWVWWKKAMVLVLMIAGVVNIVALVGGSFCAAAKAILDGHSQSA